jgi:predicted ester cyclase
MSKARHPNFRNEIELVISEDDIAVSYGRVVGTNDGEKLGIPPTGKPVECEAIGILRFADRKAVECWGVATMQQLGLIG